MREHVTKTRCVNCEISTLAVYGKSSEWLIEKDEAGAICSTYAKWKKDPCGGSQCVGLWKHTWKCSDLEILERTFLRNQAAPTHWSHKPTAPYELPWSELHVDGRWWDGMWAMFEANRRVGGNMLHAQPDKPSTAPTLLGRSCWPELPSPSDIEASQKDTKH